MVSEERILGREEIFHLSFDISHLSLQFTVLFPFSAAFDGVFKKELVV